jgi:predicted nucleotidyltransferase
MRRHQENGWEPQHRASVRHRVAVEAARILYHREVKEYWHAKREAAKRQGVPHLPSNREVHEQLLLIARKVEGDEHLRRLTAMRVQALALMERLDEFQPRLIGSVLTGHIRVGSDIDLNVHCDDVEPVVELLSGYEPVVEVVRSRKNGENQEFIHVRLANVGGFEAEITVYPVEWLSVHPRCGITGGPMRRASLAEVRLLIQTVEPEPPQLLGLTENPLDLALVARLVPELLACRGVLQNNYHHLDVYEHTLEVVRGLVEMVQTGCARFGRWSQRLAAHLSDPTLLYLAGYCHDLGKPATQSFARDGRIRFIGHEHLGADLAQGVASRLGLGDALVALIAMHLEAVMIPAEDGGGARIHRLFARTGSHLPELALLSLADVEAARGPAQSTYRLDEHARFVDFLLEQFFEGGFLANPCLPVSREDLVEQFGLTQPKPQNRLLEALMDAFVEGEFEGREEGLSLASELLYGM